MDNFSIDHKSDEILDERTRSYFEEVKSSFTIGNYRSAVVMLWSVVVCDLVFKLQRLAELHNDLTAQQILKEIDQEQEKNPNSPSWEWNLVLKVKAQTGLLDAVDQQGLENLQRQRHLAAHPIIKEGAELHRPNKDEVRALMRMALQSVLTKPALVSKRILDRLLDDVSVMQSSFAYDEELSKFLESKYFSQFSAGVAESVFKIIWKFVFRTEDGLCDTNRAINFRVLRLIARKEPGLVPGWIASSAEYYSNVSTKNEIVALLIEFLSENDGIYQHLAEHAQLTVRHGLAQNPSSKMLAAFLYENDPAYIAAVEEHVRSQVGHTIDAAVWAAFRAQKNTDLWRTTARHVANLYYSRSGGFDTADRRFSHSIAPDLKNYELADLRDLMELAGVNNQCYFRGRAKVDHADVKNRILALDAGFNLTGHPYAQFMSEVA